MTRMETFDEENINSISKFAESLVFLDDTDVDDEFLIKNLGNLIKSLSRFNRSQYDDKRVTQLLRGMTNLSFLVHSENVIQNILESNFFTIILKFMNYFIGKPFLNDTNDLNCLSRLFATMSLLTSYSERIAVKCVEYDIHQLGIKIIEQFNERSIELLNDDSKFKLYSAIIRLFKSTCQYASVRVALLRINLTEILLKEQMNKIDIFKNGRVELKYLKLDILIILANLFDDTQLETLQISQQMVDLLCQVLQEIIESYSDNDQILRNTKFYTKYEVDQYIMYLWGFKLLPSIIRIAVNDKIKQKLYEKNIVSLLEPLIENGNQIEKELSCELLCSLCLNQNALKTVKANKKLIQLLNAINSNKKTSTTTKEYCQQINGLLKNRLIKTIKKSDGHIMISYNHTYKEKCARINEELEKKGFKTWLDVNTSITDLHEAMATAVENASVILICYSYEYKISTNCRIEAQYAFTLEKPIIVLRMQDDYKPDGLV